MQVTVTLIISASKTVPDALLTVQVCPAGWLETVTV